MDELTLKPCPFCGGKAMLMEHFSAMPDWSYVRCKECGASTDCVRDPHRAVENWNKRIEEKD